MNTTKNTKVKNLLSILLGIVICTFIFYFICTYPRAFTRTYEGIRFRCGKGNIAFAEKVTIRFEGRLSKNALFGHKFKGTVQINDTFLPEHINELELKFSPFSYYQQTILVYFYHDQETNSPKSYCYGWLITDDTFNNIMIQVAETNDHNGHGWSGDNGLTIAAPATTRDEALAICNSFLQETPREPLK